MKRMFTVLAMVLAALSISFMACSVSSDNDDSSITANGVVNAEIPIIRTGLADGTYKVGATATALSVEATVSDGGTLTYQWYKNEVKITGATSKSYTPSTTTAGTFKYKVVVTNTNEGVTGNTTAAAESSATVTVKSTDPVVVDAATPLISKGLADGTYKVGATATALSVEATVSDGGTLTYQWYKGDEEIPGATSNSYTPSTEAAGTFTYKVVVTNTNNSVNGERTATSIQSAIVTVIDSTKTNAVKPVSIKGITGTTEYKQGDIASALTIEATVTDGGNLSYQWYKNEVKITGATSASYTPDTTTAGTITYKVRVTNTNNNVNGNNTAIEDFDIQVTITAIVNAETPTIKTGLAGGAYTVGDKATALTVTATVTDGGELSYKWYKGDELISGATSESYTPSTAEAGTFKYKVVVTNTKNSVNGEKTAAAESSATVIVNDIVIKNAATPLISKGLAGGAYKVGDTATALTVTATVTDGGVLSYQWYKNDVPISEATSNSYTPETTADGVFTYKVVVTNTNDSVNGEKTATAESSTTVTVMADAETPVIKTQPVGDEYCQNDAAELTVVVDDVTDGGVLSYQWYKDGVLIPGATSKSYTLDTSETGTFTYKVVVTNTNSALHGKTTATVTSDNATVTVNGNEDKIGSGNIGFDFK